MTIQHIVRWSLLSALVGILAGTSASVFLILLEGATRVRDLHPLLIGFLPVAGFFIGWIYWKFGKDIAGGNNLILDEIHDPKRVVPFRMAPFILLGTVITHLFGGSAGREGTAVQMGASLADQLTRFFKIEPTERKILLVTGAGAGFGAAIGAPWAGILFGMEVINVGRLRLFAIFECTIASFAGYFVTRLLGAPHAVYPEISVPPFSWKTLMIISAIGLLFGLAARIFIFLTHLVERIQNRFVSYPPLKPFFAGLLLVGLYALLDTTRYAGLGLPVIYESLKSDTSFIDPALKALLTALTIGSGFKGGEFIPLVFIGTTLGSALGGLLSLSTPLLAAVGFAAVFAGASNTPIACTIMAIELFGWPIAPYAIIGCFMSYYVSGHRGIYSTQLIHARKHHRLIWALRWLGELPPKLLKGNDKKGA